MTNKVNCIKTKKKYFFSVIFIWKNSLIFLLLLLFYNHLDHDISTEYILWEEDPEDIVEKETREEQGRHLEGGKTDECDEGHAKAHAHGVH